LAIFVVKYYKHFVLKVLCIKKILYNVILEIKKKEFYNG